MPDRPPSPPAPPASGDAALSDEAIRASTVLIVDDNHQNLELLHAYLEDLGCALQTAHDGLACLESVAAAAPDLILLDVMMPRMSGFQACARLKSEAHSKDIPIIMVTALNEVGDVERAVESGADDFLTKPVNKLELLTRVRSLLRVRHLKKQLDRTLDQVKKLKGQG